MTTIGYHASHEQFKPSDLLKYIQLAEKAGFNSVLSSDHFRTWNNNQGESGFAWSWLGAAMQITKMDFGIVNAPGQRYHPAIIAQAAATLAEMFPDRFWLCVGSGQALNESITGEDWPEKEIRNNRLRECADIIKSLWAGKTVSHNGLVKVREAKLDTMPPTPPLMPGAAITSKTAAWLGTWADAMITISQPHDKMKEVITAFRKNGGENKPLYLKVQLSFAKNDEEAKRGAFEQWKSNVFASSLLTELKTPEQFEQAAAFVKEEDMDQLVNISSDPEKHVKWISEYISMGFDKIILHNVNTNQEEFIKVFGQKVLPRLSNVEKNTQT